MAINNPLIPNSAYLYQRKGYTLSPEIVASLVGLLDALLIIGGGLLVYSWYVGWTPYKYSAYVIIATVGAGMTVTLLYLLGMYQLKVIVKPSEYLRKIVLISTTVCLALVVFLFGAKISAEVSRVWFFSWYLCNVAALIIARLTLSYYVVKQVHNGGLSNNLIVVGGGTQGTNLLRHILKSQHPWYRVVGIFDDRTERVSPSIMGHPVLGNLDDLVHYVRDHRSDEIVLALPWQAQERIRQIFQKLDVLPVHVSLGPDPAVLSLFPHARWRECAGLPVVEISKKPISGWQYVLKQAEDWVLGSLILLLSLPILVVTAVLVKLDSPGPIFFRQHRYGFKNQLIKVWKFRTMYADQTDQDAETLARPGDQRVTRIGAFLRRSSLDELPQILNVIKGEMSLVGPRPHALKAKAGNRLYQEVVEQYAARHKVKPGITGWAQVNGWRGETDSEDKIIRRTEFDLHYINHWSLVLDLEILLRTIGVCIRGQNAY